MSYLQNQMNVLKFDKRLLEMNLKNGTITQDDYKQHLATLKDTESNSTQLDLATEAKHAMNGEALGRAAEPETPSMPTNSDPFGSGF